MAVTVQDENNNIPVFTQTSFIGGEFVLKVPIPCMSMHVRLSEQHIPSQNSCSKRGVG